VRLVRSCRKLCGLEGQHIGRDVEGAELADHQVTRGGIGIAGKTLIARDGMAQFFAAISAKSRSYSGPR
jgi:hypothetical protein